jgi:hypothetical protein
MVQHHSDTDSKQKCQLQHPCLLAHQMERYNDVC